MLSPSTTSSKFSCFSFKICMMSEGFTKPLLGYNEAKLRCKQSHCPLAPKRRFSSKDKNFVFKMPTLTSRSTFSQHNYCVKGPFEINCLIYVFWEVCPTLTWDFQKFVNHITVARLDGALNVGMPFIRFWSKILAASPHSMSLERIIRYYEMMKSKS